MPDGKELPGLGGGGGGTDAITDKSPAKSFKKRVKDVGKILTFPISRRNIKPDPTEKFATEGVAALALKGGVKFLPKIPSALKAVTAGTLTGLSLLQARKYKTRNNPSGRVGIGKKDKRKIGNMEKEYHKKERKKEVKQSNRSDDMIVAKQGEAQKQNKLIDKYIKKQKSRKPFDSVKSEPTIENPPTFTGRVDKTKGAPTPKRTTFKKANQFEDVVPTNNVGGGQIAGTVEAGDDPPKKKKKKKTYAYGGRGSRKMWMNNK